MQIIRSCVFALALGFAPGVVASGDAHGEEPYEWAGIFDVADHDTVLWVAQKVDEAYAAATMKFVVFKEDEDHEEDLHAREDAADTLLEGADSTFTGVTVSSSAMVPTTAGAVYELTFDTSSYQSVFKINVANIDAISIFAEHIPTEFEMNTHYLLETDGHAIDPHAELPEVAATATPPPKKEWANVLLTTFLVNLATFSGVVILAFGCFPSTMSPTTQGALSGFASGALLGCAMFLILIESSHMIATDYSDEAEVAWRWGAAVLGGFLTPLFVFLLEPHKVWHAATKAEAAADVEAGKKAKATSPDDVELVVTEKQNKGTSTVFAICCGDFAHNLTDGFTIGVAFKSCDHSLAWSIVAATIAHEIAQEIADFVILTGSVGCTITQALVFNFLAGTSVIVGGLIATGIDMSQGTNGLILAYGGGTYVYLAASEALPLALALSEKLEAQSFSAIKRHYATVLFAFIVGATAIGLVLLDHTHCVPAATAEGAADPHAGHGHRFLL